MSFASITDALNQLNANLPPWPSTASAEIFLSAGVYIQINRGKYLKENNTEINFESLESNIAAARAFLGSSNPRAFGRNRRITAVPRVGGIA